MRDSGGGFRQLAVPHLGDERVGDEVWCLAEMVKGRKIGEIVQVGHGAPQEGNSALVHVVDGDGADRVVWAVKCLRDALAETCEGLIGLCRDAMSLHGEDCEAAAGVRTMSIKWLSAQAGRWCPTCAGACHQRGGPQNSVRREVAAVHGLHHIDETTGSGRPAKIVTSSHERVRPTVVRLQVHPRARGTWRSQTGQWQCAVRPAACESVSASEVTLESLDILLCADVSKELGKGGGKHSTSIQGRKS